jgi:hypothetical protein
LPASAEHCLTEPQREEEMEEDEEVEEEETCKEHGKVEAERRCKREVRQERAMSDRQPCPIVSIGVWRLREARRIGQAKASA